jgi:hypothetical protein
VDHTALMTVHSTDGPPTLESAAHQLGMAVEDIDATFGVVLIDPARGLYSVQVNAERVPHHREQDEPHRGPFSNPRIDTFRITPGKPKAEH